MNAYQSYCNLPSLAGICSMQDAMKPGLSVEECVRRLKRYHFALKRLHQIFTARITSEPIYELKMAFSLHAHYCAEHPAALRKRVGEMREPPLGLEVIPDENLATFFDEILNTPTPQELLPRVYDKALPAIKAALEEHTRDTNLLADHPSFRVIRFALLEITEAIDFGKKSIAQLIDSVTRQRVSHWLQLLDDCLAAAGRLSGTAEQVVKPI